MFFTACTAIEKYRIKSMELQIVLFLPEVDE